MKLPLLLGGLFLLATVSLPAQTAQQMLERLQQLRDQTKLSQDTALADATRRINAAAASPADAVDLYEEAIMATQFAGANRDSRKFREWKEEQDEELDNAVTRQAIQLHLKHLALTLEASRSEDPDEVAKRVQELLPAIVEVKQAMSEPEAGRNRLATSMLDTPVNNGVFSKWLQIGGYIKPGKNWEPTVGNFEGILTKMVRPPLREAKSPQLLQTWDYQIQFEEALAEQADLEAPKRAFQMRRKPELLWGRAQDQAAIGQLGPAVAAMFAVLEQNTLHPRFEAWARELETLLNEAGQPQPAASEAPEAEGASEATDVPAPAATPAAVPTTQGTRGTAPVGAAP